MDSIRIRGARTHNLKNLSLELPRDRLIVVTGLSGSGKSSLAFDTLYAEGQRRYVESLSAYARQFLEQMEKPDVESIEGLSPAIAIEQKGLGRNPRSTVGTVTEIYDFLRLLYARVGEPHCFKCGRPIGAQTIPEIVDQLLALPEGSRIQVLAPGLFSFNSPYGACPRCGGLGAHTYLDADLIVPDERLSLRQGAIAPWGRKPTQFHLALLASVGRILGFDLDTPFSELASEAR